MHPLVLISVLQACAFSVVTILIVTSRTKTQTSKQPKDLDNQFFSITAFSQTYKDKSPILSTVILRKYKSGTSIHAAGVRLRSLLKKQQELGL